MILALEVFVLLFSILGTNSQQEADHVGCYSTRFATLANYGISVKLLNWDICIHLCASKMTKFAGVQASKEMCYCGNDIGDHSQMTDSSACRVCQENTQVQCGGDTTMSLYQLTGYHPNVLLAATPNGIQIIKDKTITRIAGLTQNATAVHYHSAKHELFFVSRSKILRSSYIPVLMKYIPPTVVFEKEGLTLLAVDWVNDNIYSVSQTKGDAFRITLNGGSYYRIVFNAYYDSDLAYDPYKRFFSLCINKKELAIKDIPANIFNNMFLQNYYFKAVLKVAMDIHQELLYLIGSYEGYSKLYLASTDYKAFEFRIIYTGPELSKPFTLDVFNDEIVWGNFKNNLYTLYRAKISPRGHLENLTIEFEGTEVINTVKIYHPEAQTPSVMYSCRKKACSHTCVPVSLSYVTCTCPDEMLLNEDGKTCFDKPTTSTSTTTVSSTTIDDVSTDNRYLEVDYTESGATEEQLSSESSPPSDYSSSESIFSASSPQMEAATTTVVLLDKPRNEDSCFSVDMISFLSIARDTIIIISFLILVYLGVSQYTYNRASSFYNSNNSEQAELTCSL